MYKKGWIWEAARTGRVQEWFDEDRYGNGKKVVSDDV